MKKYFTFIILLAVISIGTTQESTPTDDLVSVSIDWNNEINNQHKYKTIYSEKDEDYIKWVYTTSKNVTGYTADSSNDKKYYHDGRGNDPLVFTIEENGEKRMEIYRNAVKPSKRKRSNFSIYIPDYQIPRIEGNLPKGVVTYYSDSSKGIEMGIETDNDQRKVKIEILDEEKNLIHIIENNVLAKGWSHYKWDISEVESGDYLLKYTVDENVMTQVIEIEKRSAIKRFFDWIF